MIVKFSKKSFVFIGLVFIILFTAWGLVRVSEVSQGVLYSGRASQGDMTLCVDVPPTFPVIGNLTCFVGTLFDHYVIAYDDEDVYFYDNTTLFNITETEGRILFTPNESQRGNHIIEITVTDDVCEGVNVTQVFELLVNASGMELDAVPNLTATEDVEFTYQLSVTGGSEPFNYTANETWFEMNETSGLINFTLNNSYVGDHWIVLSVKDIENVSDSQTILFTLNNVNDAPILDMNEDGTRDLMPNQTIMENTAFYYDVNATDPDLDIPNSDESLTFLDDSDFFVISDEGVISFTANEPYVGNRTVSISVSDGEVVDWQWVNFDIVWVNDVPYFDIDNVHTHYLSDGNFSYTLVVSDEEDGDENTGNFTFWANSSDVTLNETTGVFFMEVNTSMIGEVFTYEVNVNDTGNLSDVENISITVLNVNRAPEIDPYSPEDLNQVIEETQSLTMEGTITDPDGTTPDVKWYVDGVESSSTSITGNEYAYTYTTTYSSAGTHNITVIASDGLIAVAVEWNVTVTDKTPPLTTPGTSAPSGGGGGGGGVSPCTAVWLCNDWSECTESNEILACFEKGIRNYECGIQIRECFDKNDCGTNNTKPEEKRACTTLAHPPTCYDGIQNQGEFGVDCGGPCESCPTCYDGIQNQGEFGVDCGGPCAEKCRRIFSVMEISGWITVTGTILFLFLLLLAVRTVVKNVKKYAVVYFKR